MTAALGWLGMGGTVLAYVLLSQGRVASESLSYALLNAVGGLLAGAASAMYGAWPSAASNILWATLGLQGVLAATRRPAAEVSSRTSGCESAWAHASPVSQRGASTTAASRS